MSLHIGKALNLNDLEEGDDVYFECSIQVYMMMMTTMMMMMIIMAMMITFITSRMISASSVDFHDEYLYFAFCVS